MACWGKLEMLETFMACWGIFQPCLMTPLVSGEAWFVPASIGQLVMGALVPTHGKPRIPDQKKQQQRAWFWRYHFEILGACTLGLSPFNWDRMRHNINGYNIWDSILINN
jgi:hypothetical protein